jgi:hypothetical protein
MAYTVIGPMDPQETNEWVRNKIEKEVQESFDKFERERIDRDRIRPEERYTLNTFNTKKDED